MLIWPRVRFASVIAATCVLGACASPSTRIAIGLERYGLDRDRATCVGDHLQHNLSIAQLEQLGRAAKAFSSNGAPPARLTAGDLLRASAQIDDPKVPFEVARATAACGVLSSTPSLATPS